MSYIHKPRKRTRYIYRLAAHHASANFGLSGLPDFNTPKAIVDELAHGRANDGLAVGLEPLVDGGVVLPCNHGLAMMKGTEALNTRHCFPAYPPNPPFQPSRVNVCCVDSGSFGAGG